jgi:large subunit ribosomal protein L10
MLKRDKERIVAELTERLRLAQTLIVADYRGLSVGQVEALRGQLLEHGARFAIVKNTLTRLAAEAAGADTLVEFLDGPSAIAFVEPDGDPVAVAKVLNEVARSGRVLVIKGGVLEGKAISGGEVQDLAALPPLDVLRGQVLAAVIAPLTALAALASGPLRELVGLIDARVEQLGGGERPQPAEQRGGGTNDEASGEEAEGFSGAIEDESSTAADAGRGAKEE